MKKENGITVYEEDDVCALDEYSKELAKDIAKLLEAKNTEISNLQEETEGIKSTDTEQDKKIAELEKENIKLRNQIPNGIASGNNIHIEDSSDMELSVEKIKGEYYQASEENSPSPDYPSEIETVSGSVRIDVVNKNLFDKNNANKLSGYIDNSGYLHYDTNNKIIYVKCKTNTDYVISSKSIKGVTYFNKVPKTGLTSTNFKILTTTELTLNSKENTYLACWYYTSTLSLTEQEILNSIQIEQNLKATAYVEHQSQSVTMPVQQEMLEGDYIDDVEHHEWEKIILTGNDFNYVVQQNKNGLNYFIFRHSLVKIKGRIVSNMLKNNVDMWGTTQYIDGVSVSKSQNIINIMLSDTTITTVAQFKTKLQELYNAGTPIILYYELATPVDLELTEEQKAIQEQKLHTYKNVTNINLSDELASVDVSYKKDVETITKNCVQKEDGKGLSSNDYTDAEKEKLTNIEEDAEVNIVESIKKNGVALEVEGKAVDIGVPTKTSELTNDSSFQTKKEVSASIQSAINFTWESDL